MPGLFTTFICEYLGEKALDWGSGHVWNVIREKIPPKSYEHQLYYSLENYIANTTGCTDSNIIAPICEIIYKSVDDGVPDIVSVSSYRRICQHLSFHSLSMASLDILSNDLNKILAADTLLYRMYMLNLQQKKYQPVQSKDPTPAGKVVSIPELFWKAGKSWYDKKREPGGRFYTLDIVDHILPSGSDKPERVERKFPFNATDTDEHNIQCSRFSELLHDKNSIYQEGHFILIGEGGIGKTTTLMSAMYDAYEGKTHYKDETVIPIFVELSFAPDSQESPAYAGTSSSVIHRLIYSTILQADSKEDSSDLIRKCMNDESSIAKNTIRTYLELVNNENTRFVFLLDGLNEVSAEPFTCHRSSSAQGRILQEIEEIVNEYQSVTIVLTSRNRVYINHSTIHTFYLRGLGWEKIEEYLREKEKTAEEIKSIQYGDKGLLEVLAIPMFLTMYVLLRDTKGITTRGELLKVFFHERFERRKKEDAIYRQGDIAIKIDTDEEQSVVGKMTRGKITLPIQWLFLDILIPEIAAKMEDAQVFHISKKEVRTLFTRLFENQDSLYYGSYKCFSNNCFENQLQGEYLEDIISDFINAYNKQAARYCVAFMTCCESSMGILYKEGQDNYGFIHQHFRDYFAAVCNINRMRIAYMAFLEKDLNSARFIMRKFEDRQITPILVVFMSEYLGQHHNLNIHRENPYNYSPEKDYRDDALNERHLISNLLDIYRNQDLENSYCIYNLVELLKKANNDLSGYDFHEIDLRKCSFHRVHMDIRPGIDFTGSIINAKSWLPNGHTKLVNSAFYSTDGKYIVTASGDNSARVWDSCTGNLMHVLKGHTDNVVYACFSPDGYDIVTVSADHSAGIWDAYSGSCTHILNGHKETVLSACYSSDGKYIVTTSHDNNACIWDAYSGALIHTLKGHTGSVYSACFSPDGKCIVSASRDHSARIWDTYTGSPIKVLKGHTDIVKCACYSPEGKYIVTASYDHTAIVWDACSGKRIHTLNSHTGAVYSTCFSPDGRDIVTVSADNNACIWDAYTGKLIHTLVGHKKTVHFVRYSSDGKQIVTASFDRSVRVWDTCSGILLHTLTGHSGIVFTACFSPDGKEIVTASGDSSVRIWDTCTGELVNVLSGQIRSVYNAQYSPDNKYIVTASLYNSPQIWDVCSGLLLHTLEGHNKSIISACFSPNGKRILTASFDNNACIWDSSTGRLIQTLKGHKELLRYATYSPDGKFIVTVSKDKTARIWDAESGNCVHILKRSTGEVNSACYSPDGKFIVTASEDKNAYIWDACSGVILHTLDGHAERINSVCFSPDGKHIVTTSSDNSARIWNTLTGKPEHILEGHKDTVSSACYCPNGKIIVTTSSDKSACIWDAYNGRLIHNLNGHTKMVKCASFSPDGKQIVTASDDNSARVWNSHNGTLVHILKRHNDSVNSAYFSPDGTKIVTSSFDNSVCIWDANSYKLIKTLYEVSGLFINGVDFSNINQKSLMTDTQREIFRQYGAVMSNPKKAKQ